MPQQEIQRAQSEVAEARERLLNEPNNPNVQELLINALGVLACKQALNNDIQAAIKSYEETLEMNPTYELAIKSLPFMYMSYGNSQLLDQKDAEGAIQSFTKVLAIDPVHAQACSCLGLAHKIVGNNKATAGDIEGAVTSFETALEMNAECGAEKMLSVLYNTIGINMLAAGNTDGARLIHKAVDIDPSNASAKSHISALQRIASDAREDEKVISQHQALTSPVPAQVGAEVDVQLSGETGDSQSGA